MKYQFEISIALNIFICVNYFAYIGKIVYIENPSYKDKKIYGKMLYEVEKSGSSLFFYLCPVIFNISIL